MSDDTFDSPLSAALWLAEHGFAVFPVDHPDLERCAGMHAACDGKRGKHPEVRFTEQATSDAREVHAAWAGSPRNVGVYCGATLLVVDEDAAGELARYCDSIGVAVPATFTVVTARGRHYYFRVPAGLTFSTATGGLAGFRLDVRSGRAYVVGPGSLHESGVVYTPEDASAPVAEMPSWLIDALQARAVETEAPERYDGPANVDLAPAQREAVAAYVAERVTVCLDDLRAAQSWPDGHRDELGRGWEKLTADKAQTLRTLLGEPWCPPGDADELRRRFLDAAPVDAKWTRADAEAKWNASTKPATGAGRIGPPLGLGLHFEPVDFWRQRESLQAVHDWARARMASPWAVLGVALARLITTVPPNVVLPATIGTYASLNLFVALVGRSGAGKGAAMGTARDAVLTGQDVYTRQAGSGEGLVRQYAYRDKTGVQRVRDAVLFDIPEVDTLTALSSRQGSNLLPVMRSAWSGELLGFAYADPTKDIELKPHSYRLCAVVGVQPERAGGLFADADGGTPQRFLWLPATDATMPDEEPPEPEPWGAAAHQKWPQPVNGLHPLPLPAVAVNTIKSAHRARQRGDGKALDGQALLCRAKVTVALTLLDGRRVPTAEDWRLAGQVMEESDRCRGEIEAALSKVAERSAVSRGRLAAVAEDVQHEEAIKRLGSRLLPKIPQVSTAWSDVRRSLNSRDRANFDEVIERLADAGLVAVEEVDGGHRVKRL